MNTTSQEPTDNKSVVKPVGNWSGAARYFTADFNAGFLVFLIALPLCLGISLASGFPPVAGIFTAVIGAIVATLLSQSEMTIKGPAAGLIVIVLGCVETFGGDGMTGGWSEADQYAYRCALAVGVAAAVLQIFFGIFRAGVLGEFFPIAAVHGMLAAIGIIIISKQIPVALGVSAKGEPLELLAEIPKFVMEANPAIALIGVVSVAIMFVWPLLGRKWNLLKRVPAPLIVLLATVPMGMAFDLLHEHSYHLQNHEYQLGEQYLVQMPDKMFGMFHEMTIPEFRALGQPQAWKWVFMFFIIGTLESILSAKAVDLLDPYKRKCNMDRDVIAVGTGNLCAAMVGGLPMISEIVRSRANIDNGAKTKFANFWHGMFLLVCVALIPTVLHRIPLAALAGMLVYTGFRLAHPQEFINVYRIGREQLAIFVTTLIAVLATDLLIGIAIGIALKVAIHMANGVSFKSLFRPDLAIQEIDSQSIAIKVGQSAIFSNWIPLRREIEQCGLLQGKHVTLDMSETKLVDHSVMDKIHELEMDFEEQQLELRVIGLDGHLPVAQHALAARRRRMARVRRLTVIAPQSIEEMLETEFVRRGATGYTAIQARGAGKHDIVSTAIQGQTAVRENQPRVRIEVIATPEVCLALIEYISREVLPQHPVTACVETVDVMRLDAFSS